MSLRLLALQKSDKKAQKIRMEGLNGYKDIDRMFYYQRLPIVSEIIWTELISQYYDNPLVSHFGINKLKDLINQKYY